jgi:hypothetical protein
MKVVRSNSDTRFYFEKDDVNVINHNLKKTKIRKKSDIELALINKNIRKNYLL